MFISGPSSGLGAALARKFARQGASLCLMTRSKDSMLAMANEYKRLGATRVEFFSCDLRDEDEIQSHVMSAVESFGKFDLLILDAGRSMGCFEEIKDMRSIYYILKVNVNGVINTLVHALPAVPKMSSSRIVFVSPSNDGVVPAQYRSIYSASKHALEEFANSLRIELAEAYGEDAPSIQLINVSESSPKENLGRVNKPGSAVHKACSSLLHEVALCTRKLAKPLKLLRPLFLCGVSSFVMIYVKRTHIRPTLMMKLGD